MYYIYFLFTYWKKIPGNYTASNLCLLLQKEQNVKEGEGRSGKQAVGINNGTRSHNTAGHGGPGGPPSGGEGGPPAAKQYEPSKRLQQTQAQVDEVVDIMRVNVDKVLERDSKISELDGRADALQANASQFEASAGKLKNKYWWKNCKMMLIMGGIGGIFVIIIIVWIATKTGAVGGGGGSGSSNENNNNNNAGNVTATK